jgi:hypothetical protein
VVSWKRRRAARAHDLSRRRRRELLGRATRAMRQLGPMIIRAVLSAVRFPRVLPRDPAVGWCLPTHNGGSPRASGRLSLMDSGGFRYDACFFSSPSFPPRFAKSQTKKGGRASTGYSRVIRPPEHPLRIGARGAQAATRPLVGPTHHTFIRPPSTW